MASWAQSGDDPAVRPREWLDGSGCDAWILHTTTDDPLSNAAAWTRDAVERAGGVRRHTRPLDGVLRRARDRGARVRRARAAPAGRRQLVARREPARRGRSSPRRATCCGCSPASTRRWPARTSCSANGSPSRRRHSFEQVVSPSDGWTRRQRSSLARGGARLPRGRRRADAAAAARPRWDDNRPRRCRRIPRRGGAAARGRAPARDARDRLPAASVNERGRLSPPPRVTPSRGAGRGRGRRGRDRRGAGAPPPGAAAGRSSPARSAPPARRAVRPRACGRA